MTERLWIGILVLVPLMPKVVVAYLGGTPFFLDDLALFSALTIAVSRLLLQACVTGDLRLTLSRLAPVLGLLILYKCLVLGILSLYLPWTNRWAIGKGVLVVEGILVISKSLVFFLLYVLLYFALRSMELIRSVLNFYLLSITVVVGVGLVQFFALDHRSLTSTFRNIHVLSAPTESGGFGYSDPWTVASGVGHEHLGGFAILSACLLGGMLLCRWPGGTKQRTLAGLLWMGCVFCLIFSSSRGAWIGGACALTVFAWFAFKKGQLDRLLSLSLLVVGGFVLLNSVWGIDVIAFAEGRTIELFSMLSGTIEDDSARNRIHLFGALWNTFLSSPVFGWGPGGAGRIAEGQLIRELVEGGLLGAGLFSFIMIRTAYIALKSYRLSKDPMVQGLSIGFFCGLAGLLGQSFFTELFILTKIGTPFWVLAALVHRLSILDQQGSPAT